MTTTAKPKCCGLCRTVGHTIINCDSELALKLKTFAKSNPSKAQLMITLNSLRFPAVKFLVTHYIRSFGKISGGNEIEYSQN